MNLTILHQAWLRRGALAFCLLAFASAETRANPPGASHHHAEGGGVRSLDVCGGGDRLHIFYAEKRADQPRPRLFHRSSADAGETWSAPVMVDVARPPAHSPHRGMDPQIAAAGDRSLAVWTTAGTDAWGSGPLATALSEDGGKSWQPGPNPADDGSTTGHGFIDVATDAAGTFHLTWLDSRDGKQGLRYARSTDSGASWSANVTVKAETCECCANAIAAGPRGTIGILYRAHDPRDMHLALSTDAGLRWTADQRAGAFDWRFSGCPHVGGGLAFSPRGEVHTLVWTGSAAAAGVHHVFSADQGATWSPPHRLGDATATHPDLAADSSGRLAAAWDATDAEGRAIWTTLRSVGGAWGKPVRLTSAGSTATHPRVLATSRGFRVFWTETAASASAEWKSALLETPR